MPHFVVWFFFTTGYGNDKINAQKERRNCVRKGMVALRGRDDWGGGKDPGE
jgi:hypothetical protein